MRKKTLLHAVCLFASGILSFPLAAGAVTRAQLASYAASLDGKSGAELMSALHELMQPVTVLDYGSGTGHTWYGFWYTDRDNQTNECTNRYSSKKFYFTAHDGRSISGMNIEHSFPKSWWGGAKNNAYCDLYNLYPSDQSANSSKSNYAMATVTDVRSGEAGYDKVGRGLVNGTTQSCWEPGDRYKGDFSRSYMYMAVTYSNLTYVKTGLQTMQNDSWPSMRRWATDLYRSWSRKDSVSATEVARNNAVASLQGNRNYFVDFPYLSEYLWGDSVGTAFHPASSVSTASDDSRYTENQSQDTDPSDQPDITGKIVYERAYTPVSGSRYLIVADDGGLHAAKCVTSSRGFGYAYTDDVIDRDGVISLGNDTLAYTFTESSGGWLITDSRGRYFYHSGSYNNFNVTTDRSEATLWNVSANADGTVSIENGGHTIQYSSQYSSFGCYTDSRGTLPRLYVRCAAVTGIDGVTVNAPSPEAIYNLRGQKTSVPASMLPKGIYIQNGKKIIVR